MQLPLSLAHGIGNNSYYCNGVARRYYRCMHSWGLLRENKGFAFRTRCNSYGRYFWNAILTVFANTVLCSQCHEPAVCNNRAVHFDLKSFRGSPIACQKLVDSVTPGWLGMDKDSASVLTEKNKGQWIDAASAWMSQKSKKVAYE